MYCFIYYPQEVGLTLRLASVGFYASFGIIHVLYNLIKFVDCVILTNLILYRIITMLYNVVIIQERIYAT